MEEIDDRGHHHRTTRNKDERRGCPQGAPVWPLLSNLYIGRFILGWKTLGHQQRLGVRIVNYADDFVICCRGTAEEAMRVMRDMINRLKLTVNDAKTRLCRVPDESFDFLGYTIGRCYSPKTGRAFIGTRPSQKRVARLWREISERTCGRRGSTDVAEQVATINRKLIGWSNYLRLGPVSKTGRHRSCVLGGPKSGVHFRHHASLASPFTGYLAPSHPEAAPVDDLLGDLLLRADGIDGHQGAAQVQQL